MSCALSMAILTAGSGSRLPSEQGSLRGRLHTQPRVLHGPEGSAVVSLNSFAVVQTCSACNMTPTTLVVSENQPNMCCFLNSVVLKVWVCGCGSLLCAGVSYSI